MRQSKLERQFGKVPFYENNKCYQRAKLKKHEAVKIGDAWVCHAKRCPHRLEGGGCKLGKVGLRCENVRCSWNIKIKPGVHRCRCMEVYLDENGKCTRG